MECMKSFSWRSFSNKNRKLVKLEKLLEIRAKLGGIVKRNESLGPKKI